MSGFLTVSMAVGGVPFFVSVPPSINVSTGTSTASTSVLATVSGGLGPYSFLWELNGDLNITSPNPTANPVTINATSMAIAEPIFTVATPTVTDTGTGAVVVGPSCQVTFTRF